MYSTKVQEWIETQPNKGKNGIVIVDYYPPTYKEWIEMPQTQFVLERNKCNMNENSIKAYLLKQAKQFQLIALDKDEDDPEGYHTECLNKYNIIKSYIENM